MSARLVMLLILAASVPAWSQVEPSATGGTENTLDDTQMMMPPPVSGIPYPNQSTAETTTSFFIGGLAVHGAYIDNVLPGATATPINDFTYSILPTLTLQSTTPRQEARLSYSPSFIFYKDTSALNAVDHNADVVYQYRFSPEVAFSVQNYFIRTSNVFDSSYVFSQAGVSGSTQLPVSTVIAPFAEQLTDNFSGTVSYQFERNTMVGAGGTAAVFNLPNTTQAVGLYNSHSEGGLAFYNQRLSRSQYAGVVYLYGRVVASPTGGQVEVQTHSFLPYYTIYFNRTFSLSLSGGTERVDIGQTGTADSISWTPSAIASLGYQGSKGSFAVSYSRAVSSGGGLLGAYNTDSVNGSGSWNITRTWTATVAGAFANISNVGPLISGTFAGGHTISGQASITYALNDHLNVGAGYERLRQDYAVAVITNNPDSNQEFFTLTYQFRKPLGR